MGKEVGTKVEGGSLVLPVVQGEAKGVGAGTIRIVPKLRLDFSVCIGIGCIGIHEEIAACMDCLTDVGKACALPQNRVVAAVGTVDQRLRRGHQQALGELAQRFPGFLVQVVCLDVLGNKCGHARYLRRGHGGAGVVLIGSSVLQREDVSTRGGNFGLQLQRAGNAPAGEAADLVVGGVGRGSDGLLADVDAAGIAERISVIVRDRLCVCQQNIPAIQGQSGAGRSVGVLGKIHADGARLVVYDQHADGTVLHGSIGFCGKRQFTPVAHGNVAL